MLVMANSGLRIGILGAGAMGAEHAAAYASMPNVKVAGVYSRDAERARAVADSCGADAFTDAAALVESKAFDAIDVCLPSPVHAGFVIGALSAGKHVFCETPMALRLEEARHMRDAARQ